MKYIIIAILIVLLWILGTICGIECSKLYPNDEVIISLWIVCFIIYVIILILNFKR